MRILLLTQLFNSLTQRLFVELREWGHEVSVEFDIADSVTEEAVQLWNPDLVIAPFLKRRIPESVWSQRPCWVVHPGIPGDRGPSALDWALLEGRTNWGVTVLQAQADYDAGPVWAHAGFALREASKGEIYRREVVDATVAAVREALGRFTPGATCPPRGSVPAPAQWGQARPLLRAQDRRVDWERDDSATVLRKLRSADGNPGARASVDGQEWRLFDAHAASEAEVSRARAQGAAPGQAMARRGPALLLRTRDGALWVGHVRSTDDADPLKRSAAEALPGATGLPEWAVALDRHDPTEWDELHYREFGPPAARVGWLSFNFHNGAMDERQCRRLLQAMEHAAAQATQVLVLAGGEGFFCNGIHLHSIEAADQRPGDSAADASWRLIQAIDDVALAILGLNDRLVVSALRGNAGAGGCFLALAADEVWAHAGVVLNPHYKNMGNLYGSEYWTYLLPRRLGGDPAGPACQAIMQGRLPIGARQAQRLGLVDRSLASNAQDFDGAAREAALLLAADAKLPARVADKAARRAQDEARKPLAAYRAEELARMRRNFYGFDPSYHVARHHFVTRKPQAWTPRHLALHRALGVPA